MGGADHSIEISHVEQTVHELALDCVEQQKKVSFCILVVRGRFLMLSFFFLCTAGVFIPQPLRVVSNNR